MNALKAWIQSSREQQRRTPERYLGTYDFVMDEDTVLMTEKEFQTIERECGHYDGTWPTGEYLGKMFIRHGKLCWFSIDKKDPQNNIAIESRKIVIV